MEKITKIFILEDCKEIIRGFKTTSLKDPSQYGFEVKYEAKKIEELPLDYDIYYLLFEKTSEIAIINLKKENPDSCIYIRSAGSLSKELEEMVDKVSNLPDIFLNKIQELKKQKSEEKTKNANRLF